jgi:hypothetical protein
MRLLGGFALLLQLPQFHQHARTFRAFKDVQVIQRSIATLAQRKGTVKDVQGILRHSRTATTTDVYMQELPGGVQATVNSILKELKTGTG